MMDNERFNPFPGLRSFEADEDHLFFGRENRIDELLARLRQTRFLAVVGTSGSGKSSLVRSGMIPSLYSGFMAKAGSSWRVAVFRPGDDPIGNMADALNDPDVLGMEGEFADTNRGLLEATLRRSTLGLSECVKSARVPEGENVLVLVDQFEELFRFKRNTRIKDSGDDAVAFVKLLLEASRQEDVPVYIVITMRSDFIGNFTEFQGLAEAVNDGQYLVPRMTRDERRSAIVGPIAVGGGEISPRLVLRILNDVGDNPDQLPTMQHALMRTWDAWTSDRAPDEPIDLRHYEAIGTIKGALSQHAEEAYSELTEEGSTDIAELMFKALTDRASDNRGVRAPKRLGEIAELTGAGEEQVIGVVERFRAAGRSFLMPPSGVPLVADTIIDISHESLMRVWTRLINWVDEEAQSVQVYLRISKSAALYQEGTGGLFRDPELQLALNWKEQTTPREEWAERYDPAFDRAMVFLDHSRRQRDQEIEEKERQRKRQLQWARRLAVVLGSEAILTLLFALHAKMLKIEADENWQLAVEQKEIADEQRTEAESQREIADDQRSQAEAAKVVADEQRIIAVDQRQLAIEERFRAEAQEREALRQKKQAEEARALESEARSEAVAQKQIAVEQKDMADASRIQAEISEAEAQRLRVLSVARELAVKTSQLTQENQRELAANLALNAFRLHQKNGGDAIDPDLFGALRTTLWRLVPDEVTILRQHNDSVRTLVCSPESSLVASGSDDGTVSIIDLTSPETPVRVLSSVGHSEIRSTAWIDGIQKIAFGSLDGSVFVFGAKATDSEPLVLTGHGAGVVALAFFQRDGLLASGSIDGEVRVWDLNKTGSSTTLRLPQESGRVRALTYDSNGRLGAAIEGAGIVMWNLGDPPAAMYELNTGREVYSLAASANGNLAAGTEEGAILLWLEDLEAMPLELPGHGSAVTDLAFDKNGLRLASSSLDGSVRLWDVDQPEKKPIEFPDHDGWVWAVSFSADDESLVSGSSDRTVRVWPTRPEPLAEAICQHRTGDLTTDEWNEYLPADIVREVPCK